MGTGIIIGIATCPISTVAGAMSFRLRQLLQTAGTAPVYGAVSGGALGVAMCLGSRIGWDHAYFLPLILAEMEVGDLSIVGAVDWLALAIVVAGACGAQLLTLPDDAAGDRRLAER